MFTMAAKVRMHSVSLLILIAFVGCNGPRAASKPNGADPVAPVAPPTSVVTIGTAKPASVAAVDVAPEAMDGTEQAQTIALTGVSVQFRTVGTSYIDVAAVDDAKSSRWSKIEIQRRLLSDPSLTPQRDVLVGPKEEPHGHAATPGATYVYRARKSGSAAWSAEVSVKMPVALAPPSTPQKVSARAQGSFATQVTWESTARSAAGFEVLQNGAHVALLDPVAREFVHHGRMPAESYTYTVRAFNARGVSASSAEAKVTTPKRFENVQAEKNAPLSACTAAVKSAPRCTGNMPESVTLTGKSITLQSVPSASNCMRRRLLGEYRGCTRELGVFTFQDVITVVDSADDVDAKSQPDGDWPLLGAVAGAGSFVGGQLVTLQFREGHYTIVDSNHVCGEWQADMADPRLSPVDCGTEDLTQCAPPFARCQSMQ
jgi:hypothetical protein